MTRFPVARDIVERVVATFAASVLGLATADGVGVQDVLNIGSWKLWAASGIVAAFTLLKTLIASRVGSGAPSASLDPAVKLQPEPVSDPGSPLTS